MDDAASNRCAAPSMAPAWQIERFLGVRTKDITWVLGQKIINPTPTLGQALETYITVVTFAAQPSVVQLPTFST